MIWPLALLQRKHFSDEWLFTEKKLNEYMN